MSWLPLVAVSPNASQTTAFLARTSGLSGTETNAYTAMINGMVADGIFQKLDALYIFATNNSVTANLNLVSTSFTAVLTTGTNAPVFTADLGYTAAATSPKVLDTTLIPSTGGLNYALNSASMGVYVLNNRTSNQNSYIMGVTDTRALQLQLLNSGLTTSDINDSSFPQTANTTSQGSWFLSRTAASGAGCLTLYKNGASFGAYSSPSSTIPTLSAYILARNNAGAVNSPTTTDQLSAAWIGGGFNSIDVANFETRLNGYMTALGINVH